MTTQPPSSGAPSVPHKRSSALPWVFGGCGCLTVLFILAILGFAYLRYRAAQSLQDAIKVNRVEPPATSSSPTSTARETNGTSQAGWRTYDSRADRDRRDLKSHSVAFSFSYPATFSMSAKSDGIFADVTKYGPNGTDVAERFTVTWYEADEPKGNKGSDALLDNLGKEWTNLMPQYTCTPISTTTRKIDGVFGDGKTWEFLTRGPKPTFVAGAKAYFLHQPGITKGVRIDQYGTWVDPAVKSSVDVGNNDDLARILATFKFLPNETGSVAAPAAITPAATNIARQDQQELAGAALIWLRLLDAGKYRETFASASPSFRKGLTVEGWGKNRASMSKDFGPVVTRDENVNITTSTSQSEAGIDTVTYALKIQTTFAKAKGIEQIGMTKESGVWKVSDYSIETKPR